MIATLVHLRQAGTLAAHFSLGYFVVLTCSATCQTISLIMIVLQMMIRNRFLLLRKTARSRHRFGCFTLFFWHL
jgi:hypothetical protein